MTVAELIEQLRTMNPEALVVFSVSALEGTVKEVKGATTQTLGQAEVECAVLY